MVISTATSDCLLRQPYYTDNTSATMVCLSNMTRALINHVKKVPLKIHHTLNLGLSITIWLL
jgi:hypothetical protein